ncbi:MAG: hypothetical protein JWP57_4597 [Spirosoma sp.]|nr:hypothetical protein [Spirosoma sp.]
MEHTAEMLLAIGREVFSWEPEARPSISWPETDTDEPLQRAQTISLLKTAEAISTETAIRMAQPHLDDDQVREELARVLGEAPVVDGNTPPLGA